MDRSELVLVRRKDGSTTTMSRKTAEHPDCVGMGVVIVEQVVMVPKRFAPIVEDSPAAIGEVEDSAPEEPVKKPRKKRGPNKKKK